MTQYGDALPVAAIVLREKVAAESRMNSQDLKILG
jgi:hypothetical protein